MYNNPSGKVCIIVAIQFIILKKHRILKIFLLDRKMHIRS
jgi:hypothetical protein